MLHLLSLCPFPLDTKKLALTYCVPLFAASGGTAKIATSAASGRVEGFFHCLGQL